MACWRRFVRETLESDKDSLEMGYTQGFPYHCYSNYFKSQVYIVMSSSFSAPFGVKYNYLSPSCYLYSIGNYNKNHEYAQSEQFAPTCTGWVGFVNKMFRELFSITDYTIVHRSRRKIIINVFLFSVNNDEVQL